MSTLLKRLENTKSMCCYGYNSGQLQLLGPCQTYNKVEQFCCLTKLPV